MVFIFFVSVSFSLQGSLLLDFSEVINSNLSIVYTNSQDLNIIVNDIINNYYKLDIPIETTNKNKISYIPNILFVFKDQITTIDGETYSLTKYIPKENECYILYTKKDHSYIFVIKGNLNLFKKYIETVPEYVTNTKEVKLSNDPIIIKLEINQKILDKEKPGIFDKIKNFFSSIISKGKSLINSIISIAFPKKEKKLMSKDEMLEKLYWSGVFNILKKVNSKQDIERLIPEAKKYVKENAYAHNFPELKKYLDKIKQNCEVNGKLRSECVYYNSILQLNIKPIQGIIGMMDEDIKHTLKTKRGDCGAISVLIASIYRDLKGYDLSVPEGSDMNIVDSKSDYTKYKSKKHINIGQIKNIYIIAGNQHAFLVFCDRKYDKNKDLYLKDFVKNNCKVVDSVSYNPLRPPKGYYDPNYYKMIISEKDICFYTDKSLYDYYVSHYGKQYYDQYIGLPIGYQIACLSDF